MKTLRIVSVIALPLLSIGAIMGAIFLIQNPAGSPMEIPQSALRHSGFQSFLIPGILLLVSRGVLPLIVMGYCDFLQARLRLVDRLPGMRVVRLDHH